MADSAPKDSGKSQLGIAAIIASIGIPVAQLLIGFFQQYNAQLESVAQEKERRRLEITKLFLDNYVGKKADAQIATIQIMKALDPVFFISIEDGLKETSRSDTVRASLRRATIDAATEIADVGGKIKNKKVLKVLNAKELEKQAFNQMLNGDWKGAKTKWQQVDGDNGGWKDYDEMNRKVFSNDMIDKFSTETPANKKAMQKAMYEQLYNNYSHRMNDSLKRVLRAKMNN